MKKRRTIQAEITVRCLLVCAVLPLAAQVPAAAEKPSSLAIGASAPDFALPGIDGKIHQLREYANAKVLAVVFTCNSCPASMLAEDPLEKLYQANRGAGVALVAINPNDPKSLRLDEQSYSDVGDSLEDMRIRAEFRHLSYPYLYDGERQEVSRQFGPRVTPSVFLFDRDRKLQYTGSVEHAGEAIARMLAGRPVSAAVTAPSGCPPKWRSQAEGVAAESRALEAESVTLALTGAEELKKLRANPTGKMLVVNFWATWCGPCVSEFADLQAMFRSYRSRGVDFVTVAENAPAERPGVLRFLEKEHATSTNLLFASADTSAMQEAFDPNMGAAVPFTVVILPNGDVVYQEEGAVTLLALRRAILENLPAPKEYAGLSSYWSAK